MNSTVLLWALEGVGSCLQEQTSRCRSWLSRYKEFCRVFFISASSKIQIIWIKCWDRKNTFDEILPGRELNWSEKRQTLSIIQAIRCGNTNNDRSTREIQAVFWGTWILSPCYKKRLGSKEEEWSRRRQRAMLWEILVGVQRKPLERSAWCITKAPTDLPLPRVHGAHDSVQNHSSRNESKFF